MRKISKEEALERLRYMCSKSEKCLFDVKKKLMEWNVFEEFDTISQSLVEENYINEKRFVKSFVNDKIKYSKWGKQKVRYNLKMRGVENKFIENALDEYPIKDYTSMLKKELEKKTRSIKDTDKYKRLQKLYAFAAQRGFEADIARSILGNIEA